MGFRGCLEGFTGVYRAYRGIQRALEWSSGISRKLRRVWKDLYGGYRGLEGFRIDLG